MIAFRAFLQAFVPEIVAEDTKIHLAGWNGREHPLDVFYDGEFDEWQSNQTRRNFDRRHVIGLIAMPIPHRWMFAGAWIRQSEPVWQIETWAARKGHQTIELWVYPLERLATAESFAGRLYLSYRRIGRNSYRNAETILDEIEVSSLQETPRGIARFGGYNEVLLSMANLRRIVAEPPEDWLTALSSAAGVYLITLSDGRQYVGSATGAGGFWTRWSAYANTGHGGNVMLKKALDENADTTASGMSFAILEIADPATPREDVLRRETHWKRALGSRALGLNAN